MERYGDYNEVDEAPGKSPVLNAIKLIAIIICFSVVGLLGARLLLFNYIPASVSNIYFTDALSRYYDETDGSIGAKTQTLRAKYDDAKEGNFFCDNLIVVSEIGHLEITLRYNVSLIEKLKEELGLTELPEDTGELFTFTLRRNGEITESDNRIVGELVARTSDSFMLYTYHKLVFEGIPFDGDRIEWLRLEITVNGAKKPKTYMVAIYENNDTYSSFHDYTLKSEEVPK